MSRLLLDASWLSSIVRVTIDPLILILRGSWIFRRFFPCLCELCNILSEKPHISSANFTQVTIPRMIALTAAVGSWFNDLDRNPFPWERRDWKGDACGIREIVFVFRFFIKSWTNIKRKMSSQLPQH